MSGFGLALILLLPQSATDPSTGPSTASHDDEPQRGSFRAVFDEKHPLGDVKTQARRFGWKVAALKQQDPAGCKYDIKAETFQVHIPASYDPARPAGILVWVSPTPSGRMPGDWLAVLDQHNLIGVGADQAGNQRFILYRVSLALDAVHNLKSRYAVDENRIYASGFSGGGRLSSRLGLHYSDVFRGGIYMGGCHFYRKIANPAVENGFWPAAIPKPTSKRFTWAKSRSRHVFLIGSEDFNLVQSRGIHVQMTEKDRFSHVAFLEVPGLDHSLAGGKWLERAIVALDAPLQDGPRK